MIDTSRAAGTWYLNENYRGGHTFRTTATITGDPATGEYRGWLLSEEGVSELLDCISWDKATRLLTFRRHGSGFWRWYRGVVVEGILVGRYAHRKETGEMPASLSAYDAHVTGWNSDYLDREIVPRSYDLVLDQAVYARLRIDYAADGGYSGRLKVYHSLTGEELEHDLEVMQWDGTHIRFIRHDPAGSYVFTGSASGRTLAGVWTREGGSSETLWHGARTAILGYGLISRSQEERAQWQERTRRQLQHLLMAGNPAPLSSTVTVQAVPVEIPTDWGRRDDNPDAWPQDYRLFEVFFGYTLPNPYGGSSIERRSHGYLALPGRGATAGRHQTILALNGHSGSAWKMMHRDKDDRYWYAEGFARRGYVVLALDISHRLLEDHADLYLRHMHGDDPGHGNGAHPAIKAEGFDSDWEEIGERAWDVMRALDYLLTLPEVDPGAIMVTGLSMGGETSTVVMGLDMRVALGVLAGFAADLDVEFHHDNHPCWRWLHAEVREYIDTSDFHALAAPRPLIVQTGKLDVTYSDFKPPFAVDKQTIRRSRAAYGADIERLVHHLHDDAHRYHVGDFDPSNPDAERGIRVPLFSEPHTPRSLDWQTDESTRFYAPTLFDAINILLKKNNI